MIQLTRKLIHIVPTLAFMLSDADAIAGTVGLPVLPQGGTIVYGPLPQSIPTLSGSMLIILGLLFAVLAYRVLRTHYASKPLASIVAVGVLALGAASGNQLIQNAQAIIGFAFSNPSGGTLNITNPGEQQVSNTSGQTQRIISVTPHLGFSDFATIGTPHCTAGLIVQNSNFCYINFTGAPG